MRLNRYIAWKGWATRRKADELIASGRVTIAGRIATLGERVESADEVVVLRDDPTRPDESLVYYAYHKSRGVITHSPQRGERSIEQVSSLKGVFPVGRLDKDSEGLIILTNDGRITERLLSPRFEHEKEYVVTVRETWPKDIVSRLEAGIEENREQLTAKKMSILGMHQASIVLTEGKKHEIRRMLAACGLSVIELKRIRIMGVHLGSLGAGEYRALTGKARLSFLSDLGLPTAE